MADQDKTREEPESAFTFAVSELRRAKRTREAAAEIFGVDAASLKVMNEGQGFDPYNTSGSFDRKNSWSRIGKR
ncbi:MAG: hypothetical protein ACYDBZ_04590 [Steroidobacteraceae bacterium]